jgi:hypothetical protein
MRVVPSLSVSCKVIPGADCERSAPANVCLSIGVGVALVSAVIRANIVPSVASLPSRYANIAGSRRCGCSVWATRDDNRNLHDCEVHYFRCCFSNKHVSTTKIANERCYESFEVLQSCIGGGTPFSGGLLPSYMRYALPADGIMLNRTAEPAGGLTLPSAPVIRTTLARAARAGLSRRTGGVQTVKFVSIVTASASAARASGGALQTGNARGHTKNECRRLE